MNDSRMTRHRVWIAFNQNSIFCDLFNLFRLFPKQNSLQQHSKTQGIVLKAQSVKSEEAILETGSMFDLVYRTNTLYPSPIFIYQSSLNWSKVLAWKTSIKQVLWAHGAWPPLVHYRWKNIQNHAKPLKGTCWQRSPLQISKDLTEQTLFEEDRFEDIQA